MYSDEKMGRVIKKKEVENRKSSSENRQNVYSDEKMSRVIKKKEVENRKSSSENGQIVYSDEKIGVTRPKSQPNTDRVANS